MASNLDNVLETVRKRTTPSESERKKVRSLAAALVERVETLAKKEGMDVQVRVEGSVAKDTWLKGEPDIDIFMRVPTSTPRESFGTTYLKVAREATKGSKQIERFAEHPYLEAIVDSTRVNIVPCYRTKPGEWMSATDRTPYHTDYVKPKLDEKLKAEVRLLKRFMKGIDVYGAEIKVGGFSGYLCELLILQYTTFTNALEAAAAWRKTLILDYEKYYRGREIELRKLFEEPLVAVDPVDKGRNVASAVRQECLMEFVAASRQFLQHPHVKFFYPYPTLAYTEKQLVKEMKARGTALVFIKFGRVNTVPDILWGQLYKTQRSVRNMIKQNDFGIINDAVWSDERQLSLLVFELENRFLPQSKKHMGPPVERRLECENFLLKHSRSSATISGPRLESGRWVVDIKRGNCDAVGLLRESLWHGGRHVGVAELISKAMAKSLDILVNEEIIETYVSNNGFATFLTEYMKGKPRWL